jgi:predicted MFS family arabinose efflux permease
VSRFVPSWKLPAGAALLVLAAGFMVLFIGGGARFAIGLTLKPIVDQFGWGRSELGIAVGLFQLVSAVAMLAAGHLADRISPRTVLAGGLFLSGIAIGGMSAISAPWQAMVLYGVVFALGNGAASLVPIGVLVTRMVPDRAGFANALIMSGMSVGQLVVIATMTAVLTSLSWPSVYLLLGAAHLVLLPFLFAAIPGKLPEQAGAARPTKGLDLRAAARSRQFWLLMVIYGICGFDDFFVATHVVAFAQDRGLDIFLAGNLLALMGLAGLLGVVAAGAFSDRSGPVWPTAISFAARVAAFGLVWVDQSWVSVTIFALVFGLTFLVTAPLTVVFVAESFGTRNLGGLTGLITMVHHICGGLGAYVGAAVFDATGTYNGAFVFMLVISALAVVLTLMLQRRPAAA